MHHFRMKSFSLIPCNKKDVSNFWCYCYHFTDSSQQNLFIWSCSFSIGKRRSTSRSFLVKNFQILFRNRWHILVDFPTLLRNYFLYWDFDGEFSFMLSISYITVKWFKIWLFLDVIGSLRWWTKTDMYPKIKRAWCDTNEMIGKITLFLYIVSSKLSLFFNLIYIHFVHNTL